MVQTKQSLYHCALTTTTVVISKTYATELSTENGNRRPYPALVFQQCSNANACSKLELCSL
jgi:hypothetical protein